MQPVEVAFVVEHAGCPSCADRVRSALTSFGKVRTIEIDEADDSASVRVELSGDASLEAMNDTLVHVSVGSGHEYRIRPGSWQAAV